MNQGTEDIRCGVYQHYKGERYLVIGVARDDATEELLVIYSRLYHRDGVPLSARKLFEFLGDVSDESGNTVKRFRYVGVMDSP